MFPWIHVLMKECSYEKTNTCMTRIAKAEYERVFIAKWTLRPLFDQIRTLFSV